MLRAILFALFMFQLSSCLLFNRGDDISHSRRAAQLREIGDYDGAINEYRLHIDARLKDPRREAEENPYFYEILIGDLYLDKKNPDLALESYLSAQRHDVELPLISDRIRRVGNFYRLQGERKKALELLHRFRELDDFAFDADIDEISKELVQTEDREP